MIKQATPQEFWQSELAKHQGKLIDADNQLELSYGELDQKIENFAQNFPPQRQLVALVADNSLSFAIAYLALLRYQHVILLIEDKVTETSLHEHSTGSEKETLLAALTVKNQQLLTQYPVNHLVCGETCVQVNTNAIPLHPDLALLLSTSGSTGSPKLVKISYQNITANTHAITSYLPITSQDTVITTLPLHYSFGLSVLNTHLAQGASIVFTNATPLEKSFWQLFKEHLPSAFYGVPFSFELLNKLQLKRLPLHSIKYFAQAGGKLSLELAQSFSQWCHEHQQQLFIMYGQTEATARIAYLNPQKIPAKAHCIGQSIPGGALQLIDEKGYTISTPNTSGELCYQGGNVFIGYATNLSCLVDAEEITWLKTGDIAIFDEDGDFQITGRLKRIIKVLGKRISLDETEQYLQKSFSTQGTNIEDTTHSNANDPENTLNIALTGKDDLLMIHFDNLMFEQKINELAAQYTQINSRYIKLYHHTALPRLSNGKIAYEQLHEK